MSTWCSKHVEAWNKLSEKQILCIKLVNYLDKKWLSTVQSGFRTNARYKKWKQKWEVLGKISNHNMLQWHTGYFSKVSPEARCVFIRMTCRLCFGGCDVWAGSVNKYIAHISKFLKLYCSRNLLSLNDIHHLLHLVHVTAEKHTFWLTFNDMMSNLPADNLCE